MAKTGNLARELTRLSRRQMSGKYVRAFMSEMNGESDRAVRIVCETLVEDGLALALRRATRSLSKEDDDRLFGTAKSSGRSQRKSGWLTRSALSKQMPDSI